uniref:type II toxin-antitoxin system VapC family toxin n=1 Tax=Candidatus Electronema sp. TaxID=2698783 RepID=UPI004056DBEA
MNKYVTDTQALVRFLSGGKGISKAADLIFNRADAGEDLIIIPAVVLFEIGYLHEKGRISVSVKDLRAVLEDSLNYREERLSLEIIECAFDIPDIPELHDRLIAGTARHLRLPLLTNDPLILASSFVDCVSLSG